MYKRELLDTLGQPTIHGLLITAYICTSLSVALALYILVKVVGFQLDKLRTSTHYRIRLAIAVSLLASRVCDVSVLAHESYLDPAMTVWNAGTSIQRHIIDEEVQSLRAKLYISFLFRFFSMLLALNMLLLTINRYKHINMVIPRSCQDYFLKALLTLCALFFGLAIVIYFIRYVLAADDALTEKITRTALMGSFYYNGGHFESAATLLAITLYYALTIKLILEFSRKDGMLKHIIYFWTFILSRTHRSTRKNNRAEARNHQVLKMMMYFIIIFMTDVTVILITMLGTQGSDLNFACYQTIAYSWISLHVYCLMALYNVA
jgi:hypothetical protein